MGLNNGGGMIAANPLSVVLRDENGRIKAAQSTNPADVALVADMKAIIDDYVSYFQGVMPPGCGDFVYGRSVNQILVSSRGIIYTRS